MVIQLRVSTPKGEDIIIDLCNSLEELKTFTVKKLKEFISEKLGIGGDVRIVYQGDTLEETYTLSQYKICHMSTVQTLLILPGGL